MSDRVIILMILINVCMLNSAEAIRQLKEIESFKTKLNMAKFSILVITVVSVYIVSAVAVSDLMSLIF